MLKQRKFDGIESKDEKVQPQMTSFSYLFLASFILYLCSVFQLREIHVQHIKFELYMRIKEDVEIFSLEKC